MASIVEYMNQNGMDSSYNNRKKLAAQYGISNYSGTAAQNTQLLGMIKNGGSSNNNTVKDKQTISSNVKNTIGASKTGYDYAADITKDTKRQGEIKQHLEDDMRGNPALFQNRGAFEDYYHYNDRSQSQKDLLDQYYNKANKYGLNSYENNIADNYSNVAKQSAAEKQKNMGEALTKLYDLVGAVQNRFDGRMNELWNEMSNQTAKYLQEEADLKKLATDWYNKQVEANNFAKGGEMMSMASRMSGSGLSYGAIASSVQGVDNKWTQKYADLFGEHFNRLKDLSTTYNNMYQAIWNNKTNLTNSEKELLTNNMNTIWNGLQSYVQLGNEGVDDAYSPYKSILGGKISGITESATTEAKAQQKQSEYEAADTVAKKADIIARNLTQVYGDSYVGKDVTYQQIEAAVRSNPNNIRAALLAIPAIKKGGSNVVSSILDYGDPNDLDGLTD